MNLDDAFPLDAVPGRIRTVILHEFQGRCPTVQEVTELSDKQWLAVPGIGLTALGIIRSVTVAQPPTDDVFLSANALDELLGRLTSIQVELRCIREVLKARTEATSSSGTHLPMQHMIEHQPAVTRELRL